MTRKEQSDKLEAMAQRYGYPRATAMPIELLPEWAFEPAEDEHIPFDSELVADESRRDGPATDPDPDFDKRFAGEEGYDPEGEPGVCTTGTCGFTPVADNLPTTLYGFDQKRPDSRFDPVAGACSTCVFFIAGFATFPNGQGICSNPVVAGLLDKVATVGYVPPGVAVNGGSTSCQLHQPPS